MKTTFGGYNLFIDDERFPPKALHGNLLWVTVRSSREAMEFVLEHGIPNFISFDHDLGGDDTAMKFLHMLITYCLNENADFPKEYYVHSQNPIGRDNIKSLMDSFIKEKYA